MMKYLLIILLLFTSFSAFAQNDTTKYYTSTDYGWKWQRVKIKKSFILPSDTIGNKLGVANVGNGIYIGNGNYWTPIGGGASTLQDVTNIGNSTTNAIGDFTNNTWNINTHNTGTYGAAIFGSDNVELDSNYIANSNDLYLGWNKAAGLMATGGSTILGDWDEVRNKTKLEVNDNIKAVNIYSNGNLHTQFNHDGSGKVANGNVTWDSVGSAVIGQNISKLTIDNPSNTLDWYSNDSYLNFNGNSRRFRLGDYTNDWYGTSIDMNDDVNVRAINYRANGGHYFTGGAIVLPTSGGVITADVQSTQGAKSDSLTIKGSDGVAGYNGGGDIILQGGASFTGSGEAAGDVKIKGGIDNYAGTLVGGYIRIYTNSLERVTINSENGFVGFNNNNPTEVIDVVGTVKISKPADSYGINLLATEDGTQKVGIGNGADSVGIILVNDKTGATKVEIQGSGSIKVNGNEVITSADTSIFLQKADSTTFYPYKSNPKGYLTSYIVDSSYNGFATRKRLSLDSLILDNKINTKLSTVDSSFATGFATRLRLGYDSLILAQSIFTKRSINDTNYTGVTTRARLSYDSLVLSQSIATKGTGTVTSVATGYGLNGGTITTTGTVSIDTTKIQPKYIDLFIVAGQSNAQGAGRNALYGTPYITDTTILQYDSAKIKRCNDPVGNALFTSAWPSFAQTYKNMTGRAVCIVPSAVGGSSMQTSANTGNGTWDSTGTANLYDSSLAKTNRAIIALNNMGYTVRVAGVLLSQGEQDATVNNGTTISKAGYITAFKRMIRRYARVYRNIPFYISMTGTRIGSSDAPYDSIRQAQILVANSYQDSTVRIVFKEALGFAQRASVYMNDSVHYSPTGYNEMGRTMALNICSPQRIDYSSSSNGGGSNAFLMYGNIGINTALPVAPFHANLTVIDTVNSAFKASTDCFMGSATSTSPQITLLSAGSSSTNRGVFRGIASEGTLSAPTTVSNGRILSTYGAGGYDGSALQFPTTIDMTVDSVVSSGSVPAAIAFNTGYNTATRNEKMRIDHNGNIGIGTTTPTTYKFDMQSSNATNMRIHNTTAAGVNSGAFYYATSTLPTNSDQRFGGLSMGAINGTGGNIGASVRGYSAQAWTLGTAQGSYLSFYTTATNSASQTERMRINQDGTVNVAGLGTGVLYTNGGTLTGTNPSDSMLKNNIENLPYGLNELKQLNTKQYYYNNDSTYSDQSYGFIAQQVNRVIPAIVRPIGEGNLGLKSDAFIYISINAIKELSSKIDALEARIKILENK